MDLVAQTQDVIAGILRGCGRQSLGAIVNVAFFWFLGLPLAWILGFKAGWGIEGMWWGLSIATTVQVRKVDRLCPHRIASAHLSATDVPVSPSLTGRHVGHTMCIVNLIIQYVSASKWCMLNAVVCMCTAVTPGELLPARAW